MADDLGARLLDLVRRELLATLSNAVDAVVPDLGDLEVDDSFGPPFNGRILKRLETDDAVLAALAGLASTGGGAAHAGLHGWRDEASDAAPRGVAYVVSSGTGPVAALSVLPDADRLTMHASGLGAGQSVDLQLGNGFALTVSGAVNREVSVAFSVDAPPVVTGLAAGSRIDWKLTRASPGELIGFDVGPSVLVGAVDVGASVSADVSGAFDARARLALSKGNVRLVPGFLKELTSVDLSFPLDVELNVGPEGISLGGSRSLTVRLSGGAQRWVDLAVALPDALPDPGGVELPVVDLSFQTSVDFTLPVAPVSVHVEKLGFTLPVALRLGAPMLPDPSDLVVVEPSGAGVSLALPVISGSGVLARIGTDLAGGLAVSLPPMSATAFAVLSPPRDGDPLSFLVLLGATFPPPGVQIGFGFAISGIGGVVGVNRRVDRDALLRAVMDGSAAHLLFPSDPEEAGKHAVDALPAVFPPARGSVVAGPMFQISWGGRIITLSVAVLVEAAAQVRLTIIGKLVVALPDPEAPLVFIQATFVGYVDPAEPSVMFVASLSGSRILTSPLTGDVLLLSRGGPDATLVISAGGFHPAYRPPRGVPALQRLMMDLSPMPWLELRCDAYVALTTNTLQLGARLELVAEVGACGLRGFFAFDGLIQRSPFRFQVDVAGGIALRLFGETLMGVSLALHLEGPAPYLARGRGSIDLFFFDVPFDFEIGWGDPAPALPPPDVRTKVREALVAPASWRPRGAPPPGVVLTPAGRDSLAKATVVDPYGSISVRQEVVPLGIEIQRFDGIPVPAQRWDVREPIFGEGEGADQEIELRAEFALGQFVPSVTDDQALTAASFTSLRAGLEMRPEPAVGPDHRPAEFAWEERVISRAIPMPERESCGPFAEVLDLESLLAVMHVDDHVWWLRPSKVVVVDPEPPVASATIWSMTSGLEGIDGADLQAVTAVEMTQALDLADAPLMLVEAWEI